MNNLQYIVKDDTKTAMHMAVELCECGDFDSVGEAVRWLMQERNDAATLGGGRLTAEQVEKAIMPSDYWERVNNHPVFREGVWQAIADELNAMLGNGTCRNEWAEFGKFRCSECWTQVDALSTNTTRPMPIMYCPNCGRMVK